MKQKRPFLRFRRVSLTAVTVLAVAACGSSEEYKWDPWDVSQNQIASVNITQEDGTTEELKTGSTIGIYVIDGNGAVSLVTATVDANGNIQLPPEAFDGRVIAYSPVQPGWNTGTFNGTPLFEVQPDQSIQADYDASDLMIGTATMTTAATRSASMELSLKHMLARVMVNVVDETGSLDTENTSMRLLRMAGSVYVSLSAMKVTTVENSSLDIDMLPYSMTDRRITMIAIVAPQTIQEGADLFEFSMAGSHRKATMTSTETLEGGKTFVFQMRYTDEGLVPDGSYVADWEVDDNDIDLNIRIKK